MPGYGAVAAPVPGKTLGIVGLVLSLVGLILIPFAASIAGLIVSIMGGRQSKAAGVPNGPAKAGLIISIVGIALSIIGIIIVIIVIAVGATTLISTCGDLGPGEHLVNGVTITCG